MRLRGQVVLITGASGGVGYATARLFAREGAVVIAAARRRERLEWLVGEIAAEGHQGISIPTDVTDSLQVQRLVDEAIKLLGRIDIVVNSAGLVLKVAPLEQFSDAEWQAILNTNVTGVFNISRAVIPHMKRQSSGTIINIGSRIGKIGVANIAPFSASKFALSGLSQAMAQELRPHNVFVTTIFAGLINTDIHPLNPPRELRQQLITPEDMANAILWTCTLPPSLRVDELPLMPRRVDL